MKLGVLGAIVVLGLTYAGDYMVAKSKPLGAVVVQPFYAIHQKNGRIEFDYNVPPETQSCVVSMFPHFGDNPCWYVNSHKTRKIEI